MPARALARGLAAGVVAILAALVNPASASADTFHGTRFEMSERSHVVELRVDRGHATMVVTRVVDNPGPKSDQAMFMLSLPQGAVATRLRTAGEGRGGETIWYEGELLEAEEAARRYQELTGIGGYYPKDPALLSWRSQDSLALQVFPVLGRHAKKVEYTLRLPLTYEKGAYKLLLPALGTEALPATLRPTAVHPEDQLLVNDVPTSAGASISAGHEIEILLRPRNVSQVDGAIASFAFAEDRHLVHARLAIAPRLSEIPPQASVVVLLDTSHSMEGSLPSALAATRAYLSRFPGAEVEIVTFDRKQRSVFGSPLPVRDAVARLSTFTPKTANGSRLDDALALADAKLARSASPTRRILLLTDLLPRAALTPAAFAAKKLASGALLHVATVKNGEPALTRDDDSEWAAAPRATGGLLWDAVCYESIEQEHRKIFEEWVRPHRIEHLAITGLPEDFSESAPAALTEGDGIDFTSLANKGVANVTVEGELWSRRVRFGFSPSAKEGQRWAALVFGTPFYSELSEKEQMTLAMHGRAVSPVTSYLAIEPGVRPSTEGLEEETRGAGGLGLTGIGAGGGGASSVSVGRAKIDQSAFLEKALADALDRCKVTSGSASVTIETTLDEIVDLRDVVLTPRATNRGSGATRDETCVAEALWALSLPRSFDEVRHTYAITARR